jgi:hypothetical protein
LKWPKRELAGVKGVMGGGREFFGFFGVRVFRGFYYRGDKEIKEMKKGRF